MATKRQLVAPGQMMRTICSRGGQTTVENGEWRIAIWGAHASRVLVSASRRNRLSGKFANPRRLRPHARRARSPDCRRCPFDFMFPFPVEEARNLKCQSGIARDRKSVV